MAHFEDLDAEAREAWSRLFESYGLLQPFEQLSRKLPAIDPAELAAGVVRLTEGLELSAGALMGLGRQRFRLEFGSGAAIRGLDGTLGPGTTASIELEPGFWPGDIANAERQILGPIHVGQGASPRLVAELARVILKAAGRAAG